LAGGHVLGHIGQRRIEDRAAALPQPLERRLGVDPFAAHEHAFGLLDQPAMLQGGPDHPRSSSTGTLNAANTDSLTKTLANSSQPGSVWTLRIAAGSRWLNATAHGP
jgi:hypothetical protein